MDKRQFRVKLKNGNEPLKYFDSPKEAKKMYGSEILKYIEIVACDEKPMAKKRRENIAVVMVSKTNNEILLSETQGYRATPNRPNEKKIHKGMIYLEIGENIVLESRFIGYEKYDEILHHQWRGVKPPNKKTWKYVVKHEKSKILTMEEGIEKYGKIKKTQSGIIYLPL
jgi:hypothetical protein